MFFNALLVSLFLAFTPIISGQVPPENGQPTSNQRMASVQPLDASVHPMSNEASVQPHSKSGPSVNAPTQTQGQNSNSNARPTLLNSVNPLNNNENGINPLGGLSVNPLKNKIVSPHGDLNVNPLSGHGVNPLGQNVVNPLGQNAVNPLTGLSVNPLSQNVGNPLSQNAFNPLTGLSVNPLNENTINPLTGRPFSKPSQGLPGPASGLAYQFATLQLDIGRLRRLLTGGHLTYEGLLQNLDIFQTDLGMLQLELFNLKREGLLSTSIQLPGLDVISFNIGAVFNREGGRMTYNGLEGLGNSGSNIGGNILNNVGELSPVDLQNLRLEAIKAKADAGFGNNVLLPGGMPFYPQEGGIGSNIGMGGGLGNSFGGAVGSVGEGVSDGVGFAKDKIESGLDGGLGLNGPLNGGFNGPLNDGILGGMENAGDAVSGGVSEIASKLAASNLDGTFNSLTNSLLSISSDDAGSMKKYMRQSIAHAVELRNILYDQDWNMEYPAFDSTIKSLDDLIEKLKQGAWNEVDWNDRSAVESFVHDLNSRTHTVGWDIQRISEDFALKIPTDKLRNYSYAVPVQQPYTASNLRRS